MCIGAWAIQIAKRVNLLSQVHAHNCVNPLKFFNFIDYQLPGYHYSSDKEIIDKIERTTDSLTKNSKIIFKISSQNPNQLI